MSEFSRMLTSDTLRDVLGRWHDSLKDDRGAWAELRRMDGPLEVYVSRAYQRGFVPRLREAGFDPSNAELERLALPVGVLAHARTLRDGTAFAAMLAQAGKGSEQVRDTRFRKLMSIADTDRDGLYRMLVRLVRFVGQVAEPASLAYAGFWWSVDPLPWDPAHTGADNIRRRWAGEYYSAPRTNQPQGE